MNRILNHINKGGSGKKTKTRKGKGSRMSRRITRRNKSPSKIKYGFLLLTTHGAHNSDLPTFKLPFDMISVNAAPVGICNYIEGNETTCVNNYNLMKKILRGMMKTKKTHPKTISDTNFLSHVHTASKLLNSSYLNENNAPYRITKNKKYKMYNYKKNDLYLNKYLAYDKKNSPSAPSSGCKVDNTIMFIYMDENGKIFEENLNIVMNENNTDKSIMLDELLKYIKNAYDINKLFLLDFTCSVVFKPNTNDPSMVNANDLIPFDNRDLRSLIKRDSELRNLINKIIKPKTSRATRSHSSIKI